jgi:MinD-like ATPase involved in chromosome partitioning or flagellar assembly
MSVPVLTAVTGASWEADLVSELGRADHGLTVVRRCVDLAELLAAAAAGTARAALLSSDLRRLDRDAVVRLAAAGVAVVGLVDPGDVDAERRLRQLGVGQVLPATAGAATIAEAVVRAVSALATSEAARVVGDPRDALPQLTTPPPAPPVPPGLGRVVAVWGPTGAPGRTTLSVGLADEVSRLGISAMVIDADVYGGVVAQLLGLLDESPGLAAACRHAAGGRLDAAELARLAWAVRPTLRVLTGIVRADRWPEIRAGAIDVVLDHARRLTEVTVVDCGFSLERDEEITYDTAAPRRNGATLAVLAAADTVICVGGADPVALQRLVRAIAELRDVLPGCAPVVVVNRVRGGVIPGEPEREIAGALSRYAGVTGVTYLPDDGAAVDAALGLGRTLAEVAPDSRLRQGIVALACRLLDRPQPQRQRRRRRTASYGRPAG